MAPPPPHRSVIPAPRRVLDGTLGGALRAVLHRGGGALRAVLHRGGGALRAVLPSGLAVPEASWRRRHRALCLLLAVHALVLPVAALSLGQAPTHVLVEAGALIALLAVAAGARPRRLREGAMAVGLLSCSALLVHLSGGVIEAHFHFFLAVGALTLYQSWWPFLIAVAYTGLHHGTVGSVLGSGVYGADHDAVARPWRWAAVHAGFVLAASATHLVAWRVNEREQEAAGARLERYAQRMGIVLDATTDAIIGLDAQGRITFVNPGATRLLGRSHDDLVETSLHDLLHPDAACGEGCEVAGALRAGAAHEPFDGDAAPDEPPEVDGHPLDVVVRAPDGTRRLATGDVRPVRRLTQRTARVVTLRDVTEQRAEAAALAEAEERFSVAFEAAPIGMAIAALEGRHHQVNRAYAELTGYGREELLTRPIVLTHPEDRPAVSLACAELLAGRTSSTTLEHRILRADGGLRWVRRSVALLGGAPTPTFITQLQDVTDHRRAQELLDHRALHDPLTGLANRRLLVDRLDQALAVRRRLAGRAVAAGLALEEERVALLFIDLDRFRDVNDALGHEVGDRVLLTVAGRIRDLLTDGCTVARLSGDEFVVLIPSTTRAGAQRQAALIHTAIGERVGVGSEELRVTASIGVVLAEDEARAEDLLRDADVAMTAAKGRGRARTEHFAVALRERTSERFRLEADLGEAIDRGDLMLCYQPTVDLRSGEVEGAEALLRWHHPELGEIQPAAFLPIAEESGLILPVGLWALQEACRQAAAWQRGDHRDLVVAVNLSARQLDEPGLPEALELLLGAHELAPTSLRLEITESILLDAGSQTTPNLHALHDLGVSIGIDDFGTGYSSLTYLKRFPVDFLKIDRSFVDGLGRERQDTAIVQAVIALGRTLGLAIIGEGIETPQQAAVLRDLGCQYGQGFRFGRPQPAESITAALLEGRLGRAPASSGRSS